MDFSFTAAKGFFGVSIRGRMEVGDREVVVMSDLPPLVKSILGEDRIQQVIAKELGKVLKKQP